MKLCQGKSCFLGGSGAYVRQHVDGKIGRNWIMGSGAIVGWCRPQLVDDIRIGNNKSPSSDKEKDER
jgi:hypothetical protein